MLILLDVFIALSLTTALLPPELGRDILLDNVPLDEPFLPFLLCFHLLVLLEVLNILWVREILKFGILIMIS